MFTVPPGRDGFYYFSTFLLGWYDEVSLFDLQINGDVLCTVRLEQENTPLDLLQSACSVVIYAAQGTLGGFKFPDFLSIIFDGFKISLLFDVSSPSGDTVHVVYRTGTDTTPLGTNSVYYYNGFSGFRI